MVIKKHWITVGAYGYLLLPFLIFCLGFIKPIFSIPVSIILCYIFYRLLKRSEQGNLKFGKYDLAFGLLIICCWVWISGIGGYAFQNWDFHWRNAAFRDLINYPWPVTYAYPLQSPSESPPIYALVYYIGYWLPSAFVGKLAGWSAAQFVLAVWTILGIFIAAALLKSYLKTRIVLILLFFIFFSGMDALGAQFVRTFLNPSHYPSLWFPITHLEGWTGEFQYSSITTQLFWIFNQAVPVWICIGLHLASPDPRRSLLLFSLCFFFAPLPALGFIPFIFLEIPNKSFAPEKIKIDFYDFILRSFMKHLWEDLKRTVSPENFLGGAVILFISFAYFSSSSTSSLIGLSIFNTYMKFMFILFTLLEWLILWVIIARKYYLNLNWYIVGVMLIISPFFIIGNGINPVLRISIPALFILMVWSIESVVKPGKVNRPLLVAVLIIGAITPIFEINRSIYRIYEYYANSTQYSGQVAPNPNDELRFPPAPEMDHPGSLLADSFVSLKNLNPDQAPTFVANISNSFFEKYLIKDPPAN